MYLSRFPFQTTTFQIVCSLAVALPTYAIDMEAKIVEGSPNWNHNIFYPGQRARITVDVDAERSTSERVTGQWFDFKGDSLGSRFSLRVDSTTEVDLPSTAIGWYELRVDGDSDVRINGQDNGSYASLGVGIQPTPTTLVRTLAPYERRLGKIFRIKDNPNAGNSLTKTLTWHNSPSDIVEELCEMESKNISELLNISGDDWETDNDRPVSRGEIDDLVDKWRPIARAIANADCPRGANINQTIVHAGREDNRGDTVRTFYDENFREKVEALKRVAKEEGFNMILHTHLRGQGYRGDSGAFAETEVLLRQAGDLLNCHGHSLYNHNTRGDDGSRNFPDPDVNDWLVTSMLELRDILDRNKQHGVRNCLLIHEAGVPNHGRTDRSEDMYYDSRRDYVMPEYDEQAFQAIKNAVYGLIFTDGMIEYSEVDRDDVINDPENNLHHPESYFGAYMYAAKNRDGERANAMPKPKAFAHDAVLHFLSGKDAVGTGKIIDGNIRVFEFRDPYDGKTVHVIWTYPYETKVVSLSRLGINAGEVVSVSGMLRQPLSLIGGNRVEVSKYPIFIEGNGASDGVPILLQVDRELTPPGATMQLSVRGGPALAYGLMVPVASASGSYPPIKLNLPGRDDLSVPSKFDIVTTILASNYFLVLDANGNATFEMTVPLQFMNNDTMFDMRVLVLDRNGKVHGPSNLRRTRIVLE